jgi:superfamily II DNA or RNA helicase
MPKREKLFYDIISTCSSWNDFVEKLSTKEKDEKGALFEDFIKFYLKTETYYSTLLSNVWHHSEVPQIIAEKINLPSRDKGIDLIAETRDGEYWSIQCKYRTNTGQQITHTELSTFSSLSFQVCKKISFALVCSTTEKITDLYEKEDRIGTCAFDIWSQVSPDLFKQISEYVKKGEKPKLTESKARFHQVEAVNAAVNHFINNKNSRGKLIMPCGTGKSLTAWFIAKEIQTKHIIIAVPSLSLVKQVLTTWTRECLAINQTIDWACVCSDETVANEEIISNKQELGVPCFTDVESIKNWLLKPTNGIKLTLTTYQSSHRLSNAALAANYQADLTIFDEAHKTVGEKDKSFARLIHDNKLNSTYRIFMTATERYYVGKNDDILSMDDESKYGNTFYSMSFRRAIDSNPPILSDYNVLTIGVSREEIKKYIQKNDNVRAKNEITEDWEIEAEMLAALIALRKAMSQFPIKHAVTFHTSISKAERFKHFNDTYSSLSNDNETRTFHVSGSTPTGTRAKIISEFSNSPRAIITNARCLTEGVDVPNIDCVLFADPKNSKVDIVQATGRALRVHPGKKLGYVVIPVLHDEGTTAFELCESHSFSQIISTLRSLASNDDRITDEFYDAESSQNNGARRVQFILDTVNSVNEIHLNEFESEIKLRCWERLKHISERIRKTYRRYDKAIEFVHSLDLRTKREWSIYAMGLRKDLPELPTDISKSPWDSYKNSGWITIDAWLGVAKKTLSYTEAQDFVAKLRLRNIGEWKNYIAGKYSGKLPKLPSNIPKNPDHYYKNIKFGWKSFSHWLGIEDTEKLIHAAPMDFKEAREFVWRLNLNNVSEWTRYKNGDRPDLPLMPSNMPSNPEIIYKNSGWCSITDWVKPPTNNPIRTADSSIKTKLNYNFNEKEEPTIDETAKEDLDENGNFNYEASSRIIKTYNFKNKLEYFKEAKKNILNFPFTKIPWKPDVYYKYTGWDSWKKWLSD